jgi:hypothetical protein
MNKVAGSLTRCVRLVSRTGRWTQPSTRLGLLNPKRLGPIVYLSIFCCFWTSDIAAPGVLLDVIEQNHGDKVLRPRNRVCTTSTEAFGWQTAEADSTRHTEVLAEALSRLLFCISAFQGSQDILHAYVSREISLH